MAVEKRELWLEELAATLAAQGNMSKATTLTNLKRTESQRGTFRKLKYLRAKLHAGSVTFVTNVGPDQVVRIRFHRAQMRMWPVF